MPTRFDSIIFDLDGTLWNATNAVLEGLRAARKQVGYIHHDITAAQLQAVTGQPYEAVYEQLYPELPADKRDEFRALCAGEELVAARRPGVPLYPGLADTLAFLRAGGYRLFIVSNCQRGYVEAFFESSGLGKYFEDHQCFGTKMLPKADNIRDIVARHGLRAPVYVGDTPGDLAASRAAGVPFVFATYGFGQVTEAEAPARIAQLRDLRNVL